MYAQGSAQHQAPFEKELEQLANQHPSYAKRCQQIIRHLRSGTHPAQLGGKALKRKPGIVRFKLGQRYRLLMRKIESNWVPVSVLSHERYNNYLSRRR